MAKSYKMRGLDSSKVWDYENGFYWFSENSRISKILSHYELYKSIKNIPGHVIELGVYKATSLLRFATFRDTLENDLSRKIIGFDTFGTFPSEKLNIKNDIDFIKYFEKTGGDGLSLEEVKKLFKSKNFKNFDLIKGNIFDTLPEYLKKNPETRIAFLNLDIDVKEPTDFALELLYERIVSGGLIIFDDYNTIMGETNSADEFVKKHNLKLEKLPFYNTPAFVRV